MNPSIHLLQQHRQRQMLLQYSAPPVSVAPCWVSGSGSRGSCLLVAWRRPGRLGCWLGRGCPALVICTVRWGHDARRSLVGRGAVLPLINAVGVHAWDWNGGRCLGEGACRVHPRLHVLLLHLIAWQEAPHDNLSSRLNCQPKSEFSQHVKSDHWGPQTRHAVQLYNWAYMHSDPKEGKQAHTWTGLAATRRPATPPPTTRPSGLARDTLIPPDRLRVPLFSVGIKEPDKDSNSKRPYNQNRASDGVK